MADLSIEGLKEKIAQLRAGKGPDLSTEEDLAFAVMNLISLEEHFTMTASKTQDDKYLDLMGETRELRKKLLARFSNRHEGETWCAMKHLLAATMRLMEVGTKLWNDGKKELAKETFDGAEKCWTLFWGVRLGLAQVPKDIANPPAGGDKPWTMKEIMDKMVNCCDE